MYKIDNAGISLIASFEKIRFEAYRDNKGYSTGIGHYILPSEPWLRTAKLNKAQVLSLFRRDMAFFEVEFNRHFGEFKLNQNQVNALYDVLYNVGLTKLLASGIKSALEIMDKDKISTCFLRLDKGNAAIRARRMADLMIFFQEEPWLGLDNPIK